MRIEVIYEVPNNTNFREFLETIQDWCELMGRQIKMDGGKILND